MPHSNEHYCFHKHLLRILILNQIIYVTSSGVPRNFVRVGGGSQQIQLRTEDGENGDLGTIAP